MFYPPSRGRAKTFDELAFYAEHFYTIEVNSTFYGQPRAEVTRAWAARTSSGRLGALLAQFPASFKDTPASRDYLAGLLGAFAGYPVAVELRHKSWSDRIGDTLSLLNTSKAAWVQIDEPKFRFSIRQNYLPNIRGFYYMRLHGRNAAQWWRHEKSEDRYDYLYTADELKEFTETADAAQALVRKLYLYTNNHFSAKSVANAAMIKRQLGQPLDGEYPPEFLARYPELAGAVKTAAPSLLDGHLQD